MLEPIVLTGLGNIVTKLKLAFLLLLLSSFSLATHAGEFKWMDNFNIEARADSSGFKARLATRFNIDNLKVNAVFNQVDHASDAYMVFRLGELSHRPVDEVVRVYQGNKNKGWGQMAKSLGIKPGSKEFHALKQGHDLDSPQKQKNRASSSKGKTSKEKNKSKGNKSQKNKKKNK